VEPAHDPARLHRLKPHAVPRPDAVRGVQSAAWRTPSGLRLVYRLEGSLDALSLPAAAQSVRRDGLWRHTCFEAFVRARGEAGYAEFNFSPSGEWAAYRFDAYRAGMRELELSSEPRIDVRRDADVLQLEVCIDALPHQWAASVPLSLALTAVLEDVGGAISYWSIAHAAGRPDFHHPDGFVVEIQ